MLEIKTAYSAVFFFVQVGWALPKSTVLHIVEAPNASA